MNMNREKHTRCALFYWRPAFSLNHFWRWNEACWVATYMIICGYFFFYFIIWMQNWHSEAYDVSDDMDDESMMMMMMTLEKRRRRRIGHLRLANYQTATGFPCNWVPPSICQFRRCTGRQKMMMVMMMPAHSNPSRNWFFSNVETLGSAWGKREQ